MYLFFRRSAFPRLVSLDLSTNALTDRGCVLLAECLAALGRRPIGGPRTVLLSGNRIGAVGAEALAMSFFPQSGGDSVYTLALSGNPLGDEGVAAVAGAVSMRQASAALRLGDVGCGSRGCEALAECLPWLVWLDLSGNPLPSAAFGALLRVPAPLLRHLDLSRTCGRELIVSGWAGHGSIFARDFYQNVRNIDKVYGNRRT